MDKPYPVGTLDDYLDRICEQIQLTETQFDTAVKRYRAVGDWLTRTDGSLDKLSPEVFPQGSMLIRTTIRPMRKDKEVVPFDLDTVCRCDEVDPHQTTSQNLYGKIESRLRANENYAKRLTAEPKCLRLNYEDDDFYLDVIPASKDPTDGQGIRILIPDRAKWKPDARPIDTWHRTDPLRFAAWFESQCAVEGRYSEKRALASVSPVPPREPASVKAPLRRIVQLLKRQRDLDFLGDDCRPSSILLTTLGGRHYRGESSIADGLERVLDGIASQIEAAKPRRIVVENPADLIAPHLGGVEDLAKPMTDAAYEKFCTMISKMRTMLAAARHAAGAQRLYPVLAGSFGDRIVKRAFNAAEDAVQAANQAGRLGAAATGASIHVLTEPKVAAAVQPVRSSNFHRDR
jgi:hypothetical protein